MTLEIKFYPSTLSSSIKTREKIETLVNVTSIRKICRFKGLSIYEISFKHNFSKLSFSENLLDYISVKKL